MIYVSHTKSDTGIPFQVVLSRTTRDDNTLGVSVINLLKCVCHASLSFSDPFDNQIIKLRCYYDLICLTPEVMRRLFVY